MVAFLPFALLMGQMSLDPYGVKIDLTRVGTGKSGAVRVNGNKGKRTYTGNGRSFTINGNGNRITITGNASRMTVNGNGNTIDVAGVGTIEVPGNGNTVRWSRGLGGKKPAVSVLGNRNRVIKG